VFDFEDWIDGHVARLIAHLTHPGERAKRASGGYIARH
jgi:hypothetical protein